MADPVSSAGVSAGGDRGTPGNTVWGAFVGEIDCVCGFIFDQYDDGYALKYADPDTAIELAACPHCGRNPRLLARPEIADGS